MARHRSMALLRKTRYSHLLRELSSRKESLRSHSNAAV
jgi:hypothetical protein